VHITKFQGQKFITGLPKKKKNLHVWGSDRLIIFSSETTYLNKTWLVTLQIPNERSVDGALPELVNLYQHQLVHSQASFIN
jgi:hypothetical protein